MPSKFALQLGHLSREAVESALEDLSFFNVNWTEEQVIEALTLGYEEALSNGYVSGKYTFTYLGETIIIALNNGVFKTGFGLHSYTYDELYELFLLLGGE